MNAKIILVLILLLDSLVLFYQISELSISYKEVTFLQHSSSFLALIINSSLEYFGQNDYALRSPIIFFHILSSILLYLISAPYLKNQRERIWLVSIFILLPGTMSSAIIVNDASFIIFGLFLFIFIYQKLPEYYLYILLLIYAFLMQDFIYLFVSLLLYSYYTKNIKFLLVNFLAISISLYQYKFNIGGVPSGHFLDILGIYSAVFSPIIFIYLFFVLYKTYLKKELDIVWFISASVLIYSILLSFRQKIYIEHYAPYLFLSLLLAAKMFTSSYKVRLKNLRKNYKNIFLIAFIFLVFNSIIVLFNKELYPYIPNPRKHFAHEMHIAKEFASILKQHHIECIDSNKKMAPRLEFYQIPKCNKYTLHKLNLNISPILNVKISYKNRVIYNRYVTKLNNQ